MSIEVDSLQMYVVNSIIENLSVSDLAKIQERINNISHERWVDEESRKILEKYLDKWKDVKGLHFEFDNEKVLRYVWVIDQRFYLGEGPYMQRCAICDGEWIQWIHPSNSKSDGERSMPCRKDLQWMTRDMFCELNWFLRHYRPIWVDLGSENSWVLK